MVELKMSHMRGVRNASSSRNATSVTNDSKPTSSEMTNKDNPLIRTIIS